jgi:hypothetical protein
LTDVEDYLKGSRYKKPVYLVTGIKVGRGVNVRMDKQTGVEGRLELGVNKLRGVNLQLGPTVEGKMKHEPIYMFTESSDIVVGIQCIKIYHEKSGCLFGKKEVASEYVTSGAAFYSDNGKEEEEEEDELISFVAVRPDNYNTPRLVSRVEGAETWMLAAELETSFHHGSGPELPPAVEPVLNPFSVSPDDQCKQAPNLVWPVNSPYEVWHPA